MIPLERNTTQVDTGISIRDVVMNEIIRHYNLPKEGILFQADHFTMPRTGPVPPAVASTKTFATALDANDLQPRTIVAAHSPRVATMNDLRATVEKETVKSASRN